MAKFGVIVVKKFECANLINFTIPGYGHGPACLGGVRLPLPSFCKLGLQCACSHRPQPGWFSLLYLEQRESVYLIHECQIQPESYLKDMDG